MIESTRIQPQGALSIATQLHEYGGESKTTWKTHALVVLSSTLILIGIGLAIASFYASTIIHPMLAMSLPAGPFIAAAAIQQLTGASPLTLFRGQEVPFKGIENAGHNDCWVNSALQVLFNSPAFAKRLESLSESYTGFAHPLAPILATYRQYKAGEPINSNIIRHWLRTKTKGVTEAGQHEPMQLLEVIFEKLGTQLPVVEKSISIQNGKSTTTNSPIHFRPYKFELTPFVDTSNPTLLQTFKNYFNHTEFTPSGYQRTDLRHLKYPPEDFGVDFGQAAGMTEKFVRRVENPFAISFTSEQFGEKATYQCDAFTYHEGSFSNYGHWVAGIKVNGKWYLASDSSVRPLSDMQARNFMRHASYLHYQKMLS